jgi:CheY-like chemotaxis protein
MAIAYSIIARHQGRILVDSEPGKGARFEILLPALPPEPIGEIRTASGKKAETGLGISGHILVMDDDPIVRDISERMLKKLGCSVVSAADGREALTLYTRSMTSEKPFDAVIMDLTIPGGMGGRETLAAILAVDPRARGIVASGYSTDPIMANFREYGFKGIVAKPYRLAELQAVLESVLRT